MAMMLNYKDLVCVQGMNCLNYIPHLIFLKLSQPLTQAQISNKSLRNIKISESSEEFDVLLQTSCFRQNVFIFKLLNYFTSRNIFSK